MSEFEFGSLQLLEALNTHRRSEHAAMEVLASALRSKPTFKQVAVHVLGIPGSGKSWLGKQVNLLSGVVAFDADDLKTEAYIALCKDSKEWVSAFAHWNTESFPRKRVGEMLDERLTARYRDLRAAHPAEHVVFVGIGMPMQKDDLKFFIRIDADDMAAVYRRTALRELARVHDRYAELKACVDNQPNADLIGPDLACIYDVGCTYPEQGLQSYRDGYEQALNEMARGYTILSQAEIMDRIKAL